MTTTFFDGSDGVTVTAEAAFTPATTSLSLWGVSLWGRATWGPGTVYTDLSTRLRGFGVSRRFDRLLSRWQGGTGWMLLDNRDGALSPTNLSGPYVVGGATTILPGRRTRLLASRSGTPYPLLSGVVDDLREEIISAGPNRGDAAMRITIVDDWAELSAIDGVEQSPSGAGDTFGDRVNRVLDSVAWRGARAVDPGVTTMQATTLAKGPTTELNLTADSEGGLVWPDATGAICAAGRYGFVQDTRSTTVQATWGDVDPTHLPYVAPKPSYDRKLICNQAAYARVGGTMQTYTDDISRATFKVVKRVSRTDLISETDAQTLELARWKVAQFRWPRRRIEQITAYPRVRPDDLWPVVLGATERDLWRVVHHPPGGYTDDVNVFVSGISHTVQPGGQWQSVFDLWSAEPYLTYSTTRWGTARWGRSKWFI